MIDNLHTIAERFGEHVANQYNQLDDRGRDYADAQLADLEQADDAEYIDRCAEAIHAAAVMDGTRWVSHYAVVVDAMFAEAGRRHTAAGHQPSCRASNLYDRAYNRVARENNLEPGARIECDCGQY